MRQWLADEFQRVVNRRLGAEELERGRPDRIAPIAKAHALVHERRVRALGLREHVAVGRWRGAQKKAQLRVGHGIERVRMPPLVRAHQLVVDAVGQERWLQGTLEYG